jgi:PHS family inorganic phosphate transporter-like MFS transporter
MRPIRARGAASCSQPGVPPYDLFIIGVVASMVATEWHIDTTEKSLLSSLALPTSAFGAVIFGRIADRLGRK